MHDLNVWQMCGQIIITNSNSPLKLVECGLKFSILLLKLSMNKLASKHDQS